MSRKTNRRQFLKGATLAGAGVWIAGRSTWADDLALKSPSERLNVASIGIGGKGDSDSDQAAKHANLVAICDVDEKRLDDKAKKFPNAKKFTDFRKMFDDMGKDIDAVTISTPDHTHAVATMMAIKMGKHVYTQKPLTHDVWEARQLRLAAKEHKIASQMGNQGTASNKLREGVEVIRAGYLGNVKEVHIWTDRPTGWWPQSPTIRERPPEAAVPDYLKWNEWLGTAPQRPYAESKSEPVVKYYHPHNWRGWWDFGTGALGDMGCHLANLPFMALKLGYPTSLQADSEELNPHTFPAWARVNYNFPEREGMGPVKVTWYEGSKDGKLVLPPDDLLDKVLTDYTMARRLEHGPATKPANDKRLALSKGGSIIVGDKGILYSPHDYGGAWWLLPAENYRDYKAPTQTLARNPEGAGNVDEGQKMEWLAAAKGGPAAIGNFDYAGMLAEFILLGNVAIRAGKKLEWDGPNMKFPNAPDAEKFLRREYRDPWSL